MAAARLLPEMIPAPARTLAGARFLVPLAAAATTLACGAGPAPEQPGPAAGPPPANVVLVTLDTLRADRLGCYGHDRETSPNLDAFAAVNRKYELDMDFDSVPALCERFGLTFPEL